MKTKKLVALFLSVLMLLSSASALAADKEDVVYKEEDIARAKEYTDTLDTSGKTYDKHLTIEVASEMLDATADYNQGSVGSQWFTEHFNYDFDILAIPDSNANDKIRTMINSGDVPDVLRWNGFDINEINSYIDQGLFYRLPDDWKERWPNIAYTQSLVPVAQALEEKAGGTYSLFRVVMYHYYPGDVVVNHESVYLREDWANAVGFEIKDAYTASEIMEYARLVKEQDPGNVGANLIPLAGNTGYLANLFIRATYPQYERIYKNDAGEYVWGFSDEQTLEGLKLMKQAYDEGLISPEFYVYSEGDALNTFRVSGVAAAVVNPGSVCGTVRDGFLNDLKLDESAWHQAAIIGEDGYYHDYANDNFWGATYFSADIDPEVFERYMDIVDFMVSDNGADLRCNGMRYIDWDFDADGKKYALYDTTKYRRMSDSNFWPIYTLLGACGDDNGFNPEPADASEESLFYANQLNAVYEAKLSRLTDNSILERDWESYGFSSDAQTALTAIDYQSLVANLIVAEGDLEENWKKVIEENAYIVQPALDELNETFGQAK